MSWWWQMPGCSVMAPLMTRHWWRMTGGGDQHSAAAPSSGIFRFSAAAAHKNTTSAADDPLVMVSQSVFTITGKAPTRQLSWGRGRFALIHYANQPARSLWLVLSVAPRSDTDILRNPQTSLACLATVASAAQIEISNEKRKPSVKRNMGSVYWGGYECYLNLHQFPLTLWLKSSLQNSTK